MADWGYSHYNGPSTWGDTWPIANNPEHGQSPIDIPTGDTTKAEGWKRLKLKFRPERCTRIHNNGHTFQVDVTPPKPEEGERGFNLKYGPLSDNFALAQFHFHWGKNDKEGSEHTVNGQSFAAEAHFVHYDMTKYKDASEAIDKYKGIAVLGVLLKVGDENKGVSKLLEHFRRIAYSGEAANLDSGFNIKWLLPKRKDRQKYWHYYGSLTTPALYESVNWFVFQKPMEISSKQLEEFRQLHSIARGSNPDPRDEFKGLIPCNFRPTQPKNFTHTNEDGDKVTVCRTVYSERKKARPLKRRSQGHYKDDSGDDPDSADSMSSSDSSDED